MKNKHVSHFGEVEGFPEGSTFRSREELRVAGLHRHEVAGISGGPKDGADAIVLNEGYEDDEDHGAFIIYTGQGGQDSSGRQVKDQEYVRGNAGLRKSLLEGYPIRVIRGSKLKSPYAPQQGYRYDGLYFVEHCWEQLGKSGFKIIRFRLRKNETEAFSIADTSSERESAEKPDRTVSTVSRVVRDTELSREIKQRYDYRCQVCNVRLEGEGGPYAEAAHIMPLGRPHNGPDIDSNLLCLCPNHHALFDLGGFTINDDLTVGQVVGRVEEKPSQLDQIILSISCTVNDDLTISKTEGNLTVKPFHKLSRDCIRYHRDMFARGEVIHDIQELRPMFSDRRDQQHISELDIERKSLASVKIIEWEGYTYIGEVLHGRPHGFGVMRGLLDSAPSEIIETDEGYELVEVLESDSERERGLIYVGTWRYGKKHGWNAAYNYKNENRQFLQYEDGQVVNVGSDTDRHGWEYVGEGAFRGGHGQGCLYEIGGQMYVGGLRDSDYHGRGVWTDKAGAVWIGDAKSGKRDGIGTFINPDGRRISGLWKDDEPWAAHLYAEDGAVIATWVDGSLEKE